MMLFFLAALLFVLILFFGYRAITSLSEKQNTIALADFKVGFAGAVDAIKGNHGNVAFFTARPPATKLCIIDPEMSASQLSGYAQLIPIFRAKTGNIILLRDSAIVDTVYRDDIIVGSAGNPNYCCYDTHQSVKLRLEGIAGKALVGAANAELNRCLQA